MHAVILTQAGSPEMKTAARTAAPSGLGLRLREIRRQRGWTLAQMASCTGLAASTLSKVENGLMSLTYDKIVQLSQGLALDLSQVVSGDAVPRRPVDRSRKAQSEPGEGYRIRTTTYEYNYVCTEILHRAMVPMVGDIFATSIADFKEWIRHSGEEFTYVLEGEVDFHSEHYEVVRLKQGASIYFDSSMGHLYIKASKEPARILCVCTAPLELPGQQPAETQAPRAPVPGLRIVGAETPAKTRAKLRDRPGRLSKRPVAPG